MVNGIWLAVLGLLGASSLIVARKPDASKLIAKLAPWQGWIGAVSACWGVWGIITALLNLGWLARAPIFWITLLADSVLQAGLGLLLGVGILKTFLKNEKANEKMDLVIRRIAPWQGTMGIVAIGVGGWMVAVSILFAVV